MASRSDGAASNGARPVRLLIVDDCRIRREHLAGTLDDCGYDVVAAGDPHRLDGDSAGLRADVIVLNATTRDAQALLSRCCDGGDGPKVLVFGLREESDPLLLSCMEAGVAGYHLRTESLESLVTVLDTVVDGEPAWSPQFPATLLRRFNELTVQRRFPADITLTAREQEILDMLIAGMSNQQIAAGLFIAKHTVKNHVHNLLKKIGAKSRGEAVAMYQRRQRMDQLG